MFVISERVFRFIAYFIIFLHEAAPTIQYQKPAREFSKYAIVQPSLYHARTKRAIYSTDSTEAHHHQRVTVELEADGETLTLDLILNTDFLTQNHVLSYQQDGETKQYRPTQKELDMCQYKGEVRGKPGSWAALSTCDGVRGLFYDGKKLRYIEPEGTTASSLHLIYDHSDLVLGNGTESLRAGHRSKRHSPNERYKGTRYADEPKEPYNSNQRSSYIELVAVVDYRLYRKKRGNLQLIYKEIKDTVNLVYSMFAPLNIFVTLIGVKVWSERDEIYISESGDDALAAFLKYRFEKLLFEMPNDHAVLLTDQKFLFGVVGKAFRRKMCTREHSGSLAFWHSEVLGIMAATIAHEIGHNLAMEHDTAGCQCKGDNCIMASTTSSSSPFPFIWSDCSLNSLTMALQKGVNYCLRNVPDRLFGSPTCGNGFVERGEQCDCGVGLGKRGRCEACCHSDTCQLRSNASCATGSCCDLQTCQIKPVAELCREAVRECDLPEYCTGQSEFCPHDVYKMDTTPCGNNKAYCVRGKCRTHDSQCQLIWGRSASNGHSLCYNKNYNEVTSRGNCGYDYFKKTYLPCKQKDALCGRLQCKDFGGETEFGSQIAASKSLITLKDRTCSCSVTVIDTGTDEDLGMVPDGAMCGKDKMCMDHQCLDVTYVRNRMKIKNSLCLTNCSGHGVCNSKGNCHCDAGFAPPLCKTPGEGGSVDSGPQRNPKVLKNFMIAMYVIFLGILPMVILLLLLMCCLKARKENANLEDLLNDFKLQNCTGADFKLFNYISKSSEKKIKHETGNISKPKLRKEDIEVINDCDAATISKTKTCLEGEPKINNDNNAKTNYVSSCDRVDTTSAVNLNIKKQMRPLDSDNSKVRVIKSHPLVSLTHKNNLKPKVDNKAVILKHNEAKVSHDYTPKASESSSMSENPADKCNVKKIREMFEAE